MELEQLYQPKQSSKKLRIKVITNRSMQFLISIRQDATISDLANRALSVYLQLSGKLLANATKKQLTVSAVKQGVYYMPKSQKVCGLLYNDDKVEVVIIKAKPKYPHQLFQQECDTKKNKSLKQQEITAQPIEQYLSPQIQENQQSLEDNKAIGEGYVEVREAQTLKQESKRQKKRDKKKQKWQKRHAQTLQKKKHMHSPNNREDVQKGKQRQEAQKVAQAFPRKKNKLDIEEASKSQDKIAVKVVASPKITFHAQPKIQSPRISLLSDSGRRKMGLEGRIVDGLPKKKSEDEIKIPPKGPISPNHLFKSPSLSNKTPLMLSSNHHETHKLVQKDELSNFSLSRKGSQDKRSEGWMKRQRQGRELKGEQQINPQKKITHILSLTPENLEQKNKFQSKQVNSKQTSGQTVKGQLRLRKSLLIVESPSDSESEQNKSIGQPMYQSTRCKELKELKSRIMSFRIDSDDDV